MAELMADTEVLERLRTVEWLKDPDHSACPFCDGLRPHHRQTCPLAHVLKACHP
jgi:hypothetical protein